MQVHALRAQHALARGVVGIALKVPLAVALLSQLHAAADSAITTGGFVHTLLIVNFQLSIVSYFYI